MSLLDLTRRTIGAAKRLIDPTPPLVDRVMAAKRTRAESGHTYTERPTVSLIVLSFNHRDNIGPILDRLRRTNAGELIVCDDGSVDGSGEAWLQQLTRPNEFLIHSNDLHEIRVYNRAIGMARGEFVCVLQDDDIPPEQGGWVDDALGLFARYPNLAILGGHQGYVLNLDEPIDRIRARAVFGYREGPEWQHVAPIPSVDPVSRAPFMFVEGVSVGPVFYRRDVFVRLGGFDVAFSGPGEPGILFDHEICLRAWLSGSEVGLFGPPAFEKYVGGQGTLLYGREARKKNSVSNARRIRQVHGDRLGDVQKMVDQSNQQLRPA